MSWLLLACLSGSLFSERKIDFEPGFGTTDKIIAKLAKLDPVEMKVSERLSRRVIGVSASGQTPEVIREKIAECLQATWKKEGETLLLTQTREQTDLIEATSMKARQDRMAAELAELKAEMDGIKLLDADGAKKLVQNILKPYVTNSTADYYRQREREKFGLPSMRLLVDTLNIIGHKQLCQIQSGKRVVFSTSPNKSQVGIGRNIDKAFNQFLAQEAILADATHALDPDSVTANLGSTVGKRKTSKINLSVHGYIFGLYQVKIVGMDSEGFVTFKQQRQIGVKKLEAIMDSKAPVATDGDMIQMSESSIQLSSALQSMSGANVFKAPSEAMRKLETPAELDPLNVTNSEAIQAISKKFSKPVVANLSDVAILTSLLGSRGAKTLSMKTYLSSLDASQHEILLEGDCIFIRPADVYNSEASYTDRQVIQDTIAKAKKNGGLRLDDVGELFGQSGPVMSKVMLMMYLQFGLFGQNMMSLIEKENLIRLYTSLNKSQKEALKAGRTLGLQDFTASQTKILNSFVFDRENLNVSVPPPPGIYYVMWEHGPHREQTELCPNGGLNPEFTVNVAYTEGPSWFADFGHYDGLAPATPVSLSYIVYKSERPDVLGKPGPITFENADFLKGDAVSWLFTFTLKKEVPMNDTLNDHHIDRSKTYKKGDLPADFLKQIEAEVNHLRESFKDVGRGRNTQIPPP